MKRVDVYSEKWLPYVERVFSNRGVFIGPTETVYGFHCDARDDDAVEQIFALKHRPDGKPLIVLANSMEMVAEYCEMPDDLEEWLGSYWPGPLSVIIPARPGKFSDVTLGGGDTVAIRLTAFEVMRRCVEVNGGPIVSTSANVSGRDILRKAQDLYESFSTVPNAPELFLDAGDLSDMLPTTIIDSTQFPWRIVRNGALIPLFPHAS